MKWVRVAVNIGSDPSIGVIADTLRIKLSHAVGLCTLVFVQMPEHARDGDLSQVSNSTLENWAHWHGKAGAFAAIFRTQLCDADGRVKAWEKHNGAAIRKADVDAERQRNWRDRHTTPADSPPPVTQGVTRDITRNEAMDGTGRDGTNSELHHPPLARAEVGLAGRPELLQAVKASRSALAVVSEAVMLAEGGERPGAGVQAAVGWPTVIQALDEMTSKGSAITPRGLAGFVRTLTARESVPPATRSTAGTRTFERGMAIARGGRRIPA